jgi:UDP-glucose 4-epimerase
MRQACIFGAGGFIGSNISVALVAAGWSVTAIDGFLPRTSAARAHLDPIIDRIALVDRRVEDLPSLPALIEKADLIVDCMGWTRHWEAQADPRYDLELNIASHLPLLAALAEVRTPLVVYLGSTHQYGRAYGSIMSESTPFQAADTQSIHKAAADHHYRLAAERNGLRVVSLRFGNTFGPNQPIDGRDIGLIGEFIVTALKNEAIAVFGRHRSRTIAYAGDLAHTILRLADANIFGFTPLNFGGRTLAILDLAQHIVQAAGTGKVEEHPLPPDVAAMDIVTANLDCSRIEQLLGPTRETPLPQALTATIESIRQRLRC